MRFLLSILFLVVFCNIKSVAQVIINPTFERTDTPSFRVEKVEITLDTTFVYCTYQAEEDSWANISPDTYIKDIQSGACFPLLRASGLPLSPERIQFSNNVIIPVCLFFPHVNTDKFDIIELENKKAFNIYGININQTFTDSYTSEDIATFFNLSQKEEDMENWQSAINYSLKQLDAADYVEGIRSFPSACAMYNLTMQFIIGTKEYNKAIEWGEKAIEIINSLPKDSTRLDVLARTYGNVGTAYHMMGEHEKGKQYEELSLATRRLKKGVGVLPYEKYLANLAKDYYYEMNYPKALLYGREVANIYENEYKTDPQFACVYANSLSNLCEYYHQMGKYEEAVESGMLALEIMNKESCEEYPFLKFGIYNNLALVLKSAGHEEDALKLIELAIADSDLVKPVFFREYINLRITYAGIQKDTVMAIREYESIIKTLEDSISKGGGYNDEYTKVLMRSYYLNISKNIDVALNCLRKAIAVEERRHGDESIAYANYLLCYISKTWAESLQDTKKTDSLFLYVQKATSIIKRYINYSLYNLSQSEREYYWRYYLSFISWFIPTLCSFTQTEESSALAFDAALFYKGILLSSEKEFKEVFLSSNDSTLIGLYTEYVRNLVLLENEYMYASISPRIDSIKTNIRDLSFILSQKATRTMRQFNCTSCSWQEVKNALKDDDIAIEFVSYDSVDDQNTIYDAYVIDNKSDSPDYLHLCVEKDILACVRRDSINYDSLSVLIWRNKGLYDLIKDKKNIYFSASGILNSIGIEYLTIADAKNIQDVYNVYRLSSTRELCFPHEYVKPQNVCLYGGLDYNSSYKISSDNTVQSYRVSRAVVDTLVSRGGFEPLIGSKQEINFIKDELSKINLTCKTYIDSKGTEESFKKLSGCQLSIIHLSTHGMYVPFEEEEQVKQKYNFRFLLSEESPNVDLESAALSHSFLVMSGGNMLIHKDSLQEGTEDGILTALEVSHLDFQDLDLVVLSACQTALGLIGSEGVYGLQRGFKKAGANTILMSLNKVDDEATRILMVEFYKNLMAGKSKYQSLKDAQHYLRQVENGKYDAPKYWASFILLDALN